MRYYVYRYGSNAANQSMCNCARVAEVEAPDEDRACSLAAKRVTVYNNQFLSAELANEVDTRESEVDRLVAVL